MMICSALFAYKHCLRAIEYFLRGVDDNQCDSCIKKLLDSNLV